MRLFNTAGPCRPDWHYVLPASVRLGDARELIDKAGYFVLHAPRQTGKTTSLRALAQELTAEGKYAALHFSCETGSTGDDPILAQQMIVASIVRSATQHLPSELHPPQPWVSMFPGSLLVDGLAAWARVCPRPLVLFFDEIDALRGDSLITVLRQLRAGYPDRPTGFPHAVVLCGLRDVRDYKTASGGDGDRFGTSSPFNIKVESIRLADFTADEVRTLYFQHSAETGQAFEEDAIARAFELTQGQPWLVNALAREVVEEMKVQGPITAAHVDQAKERLILARQTHLDSLVARLQEDRVRRVLEPVLGSGDELPNPDLTFDDDWSYVRDLGLIAPNLPPRLANPIYREVVARVLTLATPVSFASGLDPRAFIRPDGTFDMPRMMREFADFWRLHEEFIDARKAYAEAAAQLVLMAFLQRVVNGGGYVDREYGIGRGAIDVVVRWPWTDTQGKRQLQREVLELKVWRTGRADPLPAGLLQLDAYLAGLGLDAGLLVLFDRRNGRRPVAERIETFSATSANGRAVTVWRL